MTDPDALVREMREQADADERELPERDSWAVMRRGADALQASRERERALRDAATFKHVVLVYDGDTLRGTPFRGEWCVVPREDFDRLRALLDKRGEEGSP